MSIMIDRIASVHLAAVGGLIIASAILLDKTAFGLIPLLGVLLILSCKAIRSIRPEADEQPRRL